MYIYIYLLDGRGSVCVVATLVGAGECEDVIAVLLVVCNCVLACSCNTSVTDTVAASSIHSEEGYINMVWI